MTARGRIRGITGHLHQPLGKWELAGGAPGAFADLASLKTGRLDWMPAAVPSTVASVFRDSGAWSLDRAGRRFDGEEYWYRTRFAAEPAAKGEQLWLCFDGLATIADVWLNDRHVLASQDMFTAHELRVDGQLGTDNELLIRFRSLDEALNARRPRPRWRAPMVENQQIRWFRTTLLGRTPGWSPRAAPVGPWRPVRLERRSGVTFDDVRLDADATGRLDVSCRAAALDGVLSGLSIVLEHAGREYRAALSASGDRFTGRLVVPDARQWWPHTHGVPALYQARLRAERKGGVVEADLGAVGFRTVSVDTGHGGFAVSVNGAPVFCRGACWTPLDVVSLAASPQALDQAFEQVVGAGMNMLRVGGMMVYESDDFLDRCDARGVMLWQDFMFANLDYPEEDADFLEAVNGEAGQLLSRLQGRPGVAVLCGNSEVEQQAAMWGAPRERWRPALFEERLAALAREQCPGVPYWPSSTHGGAFPHEANAGTSSYYGVGAYLRPLEDARRAEVRFASECLAFANIPDPPGMVYLPGGPGSKVHDPSWKARTPRDLGAGWDFDDVRDHYVASLFRVDPLQLRYADHERYLALGRVTTGEVMAAVFAEWRRQRSPTRGGLIWFLRDLWPGAGWGVIGSKGTPKAAWHYLRRALAPVALSLSDEGGNGLGVHVVNDGAETLQAELELSLYRFGDVRVGQGVRPVTVEPRSAIELNGVALFDDFLDLSYAYRFGPPSHEVVVAMLRVDGAVLARAFHFVPGLPNSRERDVGLHAEARAGASHWSLAVRTARLAQSVSVEIDGYQPDDNYFHMAPGEERVLLLKPLPQTGDRTAPPRGTVRALNAEVAATVSLAQEP